MSNNLIGAVNAITKEVITLSNTTYITAETIVAFLKQLKEHYGETPIKIEVYKKKNYPDYFTVYRTQFTSASDRDVAIAFGFKN